ncbi:CPBP family intramembrane glutamic endopeptidase [Konateibacter massiliensis]|uniref:CPBP family intramembrane glutamic endopeptidase n=1 Tax=Konateibacter massiliensis TaxID=2002841 RepID=UPI000C14AE18|nr:CPBP family intramembrane glutamic endopeptidase [Konateibacter massiliensis]
MKRDNIFMKIWRIVYPVGIYFMITNIISVIFAVLAAFSVMMPLISGQKELDPIALQEELISIVYQYSLLLTAIAAAITIPIAALLMRSDRRRETREYKSVSPGLYGLVVIAAISACMTGNQLLTISQLDKIFPGFNQLQEVIYGGGIVLEVAAVVILAPIVEELLFRGMVFKRLYGYYGRMPALIISSLFFGVYHGNVVQGVYAFGIGLLFAFVYDKYKTIAAPILAHMIANLTSVISSETPIFDFIYNSYEKNVVIYFYVLTVVVTAICIGSVILISKWVHAEEIKKVEEAEAYDVQG